MSRVFKVDYIADPARGRPLWNAKIYVGIPNEDPTIPSNQIQLTGDIGFPVGQSIPVPQPVRTNKGGVTVYNNSPLDLNAPGQQYAIAIYDRNDNLIYNFPQVDGSVAMNTTSQEEVTGLTIWPEVGEAVIGQTIPAGTDAIRYPLNGRSTLFTIKPPVAVTGLITDITINSSGIGTLEVDNSDVYDLAEFNSYIAANDGDSQLAGGAIWPLSSQDSLSLGAQSTVVSIDADRFRVNTGSEVELLWLFDKFQSLPGAPYTIENIVTDGFGAYVLTVDGVDYIIATPKILHFRSKNDIRGYNGVADYTGTPQYDGTDPSNITSSDNTPNLSACMNLDYAEQGVLKIRFPRGHFGFKTAEIERIATANCNTLVFEGEGYDETILDFIFEDATNTSIVGPDEANVLLRLQGFDKVKYRNMTTKCTTNLNPVDGNFNKDQDNESVYYGAVWFSHNYECGKVVFDRVWARTSNYRCHNVLGLEVFGQSDDKTVCEIRDSFGDRCSSTPFWLEFCSITRVFSSELYRNGVLGLSATGYGITTQRNCDDVYFYNSRFYENYRKGWDRKGGIGKAEIIDCYFADNVIFDLSDNRRFSGGSNYPAGLKARTFVSGCKFLLNRNPSFLQEALDALTGGNGKVHYFWFMGDKDTTGTLQDRLLQVQISDCDIKVYGGMTGQYDRLNLFHSAAENTIYEDLRIDTRAINLNTTGTNVSDYRIFQLENPDATVSLENCKSIKLRNGNMDQGCTPLFQMQPYAGTGSLTIVGNSMDLNSHLLVAATSGGGANIADWVGPRFINDNNITIRDLNLNSFGSSRPNAYNWLSSVYWFTDPTRTNYSQKNTIGLGDADQYYDWTYSDIASEKQSIDIDFSNLQIGDTVTVLTGAIDGNVQFDATGKLEVSGDNYRVYYRSTGLIRVLVESSAYVVTNAAFPLPVQYAGGNTNFVGTAVDFEVIQAIPNSGMYSLDISSTQNFYPSTALISE